MSNAGADRKGGRFNEGKALDAVLRRIEERDGVTRADVRSPERDGHEVPIDLAGSLGGRLCAFEHTGIEPFPGQIERAEHAAKLFGPIADRLTGALPAEDYFELHVPIDATVGLKRGQIPDVQDVLVRWVREMAPTLPAAPYGRYVLPVSKVFVSSVPFPVTLHRSTDAGRLRGKFHILQLVNGEGANLETARQARLAEVCGKKFGKLAKWKERYCARTILVLEWNDFQLTNDQLVAVALAGAEAGRDDKPDEVYLVSTDIDDQWHVTCLRRDGKTYYEDGERFWPVDPATLTPLTDR